MLCLPCHVANNQIINYENRTLRVHDDDLPMNQVTNNQSSKVKVTNLGPKKFHQFLIKGMSVIFQVSQVVARKLSNDLLEMKEVKQH